MQKFRMVNPFKSVTSEGSKARSVRDMVRTHIIREMRGQRHNKKEIDRPRKHTQKERDKDIKHIF